MDDERSGGDLPGFTVENASLVAAVLTLALVPAAEFAVMPDRLPASDPTPASRVEALRERLLREAKNAAVLKGWSFEAEAEGVTEAIAIINWICDDLRKKI